MKAATFDRAVAECGLTAVRQMSAGGFPIMPPSPFTQGSQAPDRVDAAEDPPPVSAAFLHFTESGPAQPDMTAPVRPPEPFAGAVTSLTQGSAAAEARAAHNRQVAGSTPAPATSPACGVSLPQAAPAADNAGAVTLSDPAMILLKAIASYEQLDLAAALTMALATHATKIGAGPLARAALDEIERHGDITDVPEYRRSGERRFRSGGP